MQIKAHLAAQAADRRMAENFLPYSRRDPLSATFLSFLLSL